jgi:hypothetical protein
MHCSEITNGKVCPIRNYDRVITTQKLLLKLKVCTKKCYIRIIGIFLVRTGHAGLRILPYK